MSSRRKQSKNQKPKDAGAANAGTRKSAHAPILDRRRDAKKHSGKSVGRLFEDLVAVQARLRAPGGCPWDREQTHLTLRTYLIEEAYEVLDAIETGNPRELAEELGDLLLQVLFHADLAREAGAFEISDVIAGIHDKLIRRHPHVFGDVKAGTPGEILKNWVKLKAAEKQDAAARVGAAKPPETSILDAVARSLPALLEAHQMTRRVAQVGFDWERVEGILEKILDESKEFKSALAASNPQAVEEEVGDILFAAVNLARFLDLDPEVALKRSNLKFKERFQEMERQASCSGQRLSDLSKDELESLWQAAKAKSRVQVSSRHGS